MCLFFYTQVAALTQFYQIFPDEAANPLYITGESYGGMCWEGVDLGFMPVCLTVRHPRTGHYIPAFG